MPPYRSIWKNWSYFYFTIQRLQCFSYFSHHCDWMPDNKQFKEGRVSVTQFEGTAHPGGEFMAAGERQLSHNTHGQAADLLNASTQSNSLLFIQTRAPPRECCHPRLGWPLLPLLIQPRHNLMGTPRDLFPRQFEILSNWGYKAFHLHSKPCLVPLPQTEPVPDNRALTMGPLTKHCQSRERPCRWVLNECACSGHTGRGKQRQKGDIVFFPPSPTNKQEFL